MRLSILFFLFIIQFSFLFANTTEEFLNNTNSMQRSTEEGNRRLITLLSNEIVQNPESYELNWQFAAILYFQGYYYERAKEARIAYFKRAIEHAEKAKSINPDGIDGHYWLAVSYASWSEERGILESLYYVEKVVNEISKVINTNPKFLNGLPWIIRAKAYNFAPGWPISLGNKEKSYEDAKMALKIGESNRLVYMLYTDILLNDGKYQECREAIEKGLNLPFDERLFREEEHAITDLKKKLRKLQK